MDFWNIYQRLEKSSFVDRSMELVCVYGLWKNPISFTGSVP